MLPVRICAGGVGEPAFLPPHFGYATNRALAPSPAKFAAIEAVEVESGATNE